MEACRASKGKSRHQERMMGGREGEAGGMRPVGRQRTFVSVRQPICGPAVPPVIVSSFVTIQFDFLFRQAEAYPYLLNFFLFFFFFLRGGGGGQRMHYILKLVDFFCFCGNAFAFILRK